MQQIYKYLQKTGIPTYVPIWRNANFDIEFCEKCRIINQRTVYNLIYYVINNKLIEMICKKSTKFIIHLFIYAIIQNIGISILQKYI